MKTNDGLITVARCYNNNKSNNDKQLTRSELQTRDYCFTVTAWRTHAYGVLNINTM